MDSGINSIFNSWDNRHQLLFPLGFSLICIALLLRLDFRIRKVFISFLLSSIVLINISNYYYFHKDWIKQTNIIDQISKDKIIKNSDILILKIILLKIIFIIWDIGILTGTVLFNCFKYKFKNWIEY